MKKSTTALLASSLAALALAPVSPLVQASAARTPTPPSDVTTPLPTEEPTAPEESPPTDTGSPTESPTDETSPTESPTGEAAAPFGPGCASLPATGKGSLESLSSLPVASAVADSPQLSTLSKAITQAGLADRLNSAEDLTVFAPTDEAFAQLPEEELKGLLADKDRLTKLLTYHVVEGRQEQGDLSDATLKSLEGGELTVKGSGDEYTVNDAKITCGGIPTSNATVYLVDKVLMPQ